MVTAGELVVAGATPHAVVAVPPLDVIAAWATQNGVVAASRDGAVGTSAENQPVVARSPVHIVVAAEGPDLVAAKAAHVVVGGRALQAVSALRPVDERGRGRRRQCGRQTEHKGRCSDLS
ncbi:MAG TPA: hypothetical protein VFD59_13560 [Nocardioidaceae bacterium]|nr:hypothetical protein [Nocardioidaceae bacterium]